MGIRSERRGGPLTSQGELLLDLELRRWIELVDVARPRVRGDCMDKRGPCPFVGCRYHLWHERMSEFEELVEAGPNDWGDTCALDIADRTRAPKSRRLEERRSSYDPPSEPIGRPGPVVVREGGLRRWVWPEPPLDAPTESNRAVVGRFLGGLSREVVRRDELVGLRALREDPAIIEAYPWVRGVGELEEDLRP